MSRIWSLYSMNYAQNSIFLGLREAWRVCAKKLDTNQLILIKWVAKVHTAFGMEVMQEGR